MKNILRRTLLAGIVALLLLPFSVMAQVNGEYRSAASGIWSVPATWEIYNAGSGAWAVASAAPTGATAIITVRNGHTITLGTNHSFKKLTVATGGSVVADGSERRLDLAGDTSFVINNGNIGGVSGSAESKLNIANTATCTIATLSGSGSTSISRIRFNTSTSSITNLSTLIIDQDLTVLSSGITAWYNASGNTNAENCVITINAGRTVTMSGALHNVAVAPTLLGGNYTYNINGTLDMSGTSTTTYLYPINNNASVVTINVSGVWKIAKLDAAYTGTNAGSVQLNILSGGVVDATKASVFAMGSKYFLLPGSGNTGQLKRIVSTSTGSVTFPIGTSATAYNPLIMASTTDDDTVVAVNVRFPLTNAIGDPSKIVSKQWEISPSSTGTGLTASFNWQTADQAAGFVQGNPLSIFHYTGTTWVGTPAGTITGSGTIAAPYTTSAATAPTALSGRYVVGNTSAQVVVVPTVSIAAAPGNTVCAGVPVTFTATTTNATGAHYQWKVNGSNVGTDAATYTSSTLANNSVVTCVISLTVGGPDAATSNAITMTVNPLANAGTISGSGTVCSGTTEQLTTTGTGGTWSSSNTAIATVAATGLVSGVTVGNATISYTATNGCGTVVATKTMAVTLGASAGTLSGTATLCPAGTSQLSSTATGGVWSSNNTAVATVSTAGLVTAIAGGSATIAYVVVNGCGSDTAKRIVTVNSATTAGTLSGFTTMCTGTTSTLTSSVSGGTWSVAGPATITSAGVVTPTGAGTATVTYTVVGACGTATATRVITITTVPTVAAITGIATVCEGAAITLGNTTTGGVWSNANNSILSVTSTGVVTGVGAGSDVVSYTVTNGCGNAVATKTISVNGLPTATTVVGADSLCLRGTTTLVSGSIDGAWSSRGVITSVTIDGIVTGLAVGVDTIIYNITNSCGSAKTYHLITIYDCNPTGIKHVAKNVLDPVVFPNPTNGLFACTINALQKEGVKIVLTNMMGSVIAMKDASTNEPITFDVKPAPGMYFLNAVSEHGRASIKVNIID